MSDVIVTGKAYRVLTGVDPEEWSKISFWTSADDVEFISDNKTLPELMDEKAPLENPAFSGNVSIGDDSSASGDNSFVGGEATASGDNSIAYGLSVTNPYDNAAVFGKYNKTSNISDILLMVGNGTADNSRSNAMELYDDGDVVFSGTISSSNISTTGDITASGDITDGNGEKISDKLDLDDLESEVTYTTSIPLMNLLKVGQLDVGAQSYDVYNPVPDFNVQNSSDPGYIANKPTIPSTASDLTVTGGGNLQTCLDNMQQEISEIPKMKKEVVNSLPTTNIDTDTLYLLVTSSQTPQGSLYDEYINLDGTTSGWELIGSQTGTIDLSNYYTKAQTEQKISDAIAAIFSTGQAGQFLVSDGNGGYNWVSVPTAEGNSF